MKKNLLLVIFLLIGTGIFAQTYNVNDKVSISWKGSWYPGKILEVKNNTYLVSYDNYGPKWNEYVTADRLKPLGSSTTGTNSSGENPNPIAVTNSTDTASSISFLGIGTVDDLQLSPDGKYLYAANGALEILNANDLSVVTEIKVTGKYFVSVSISHDGQFLAVGGNQGQLMIYKSSDEINFTEYFSYDSYDQIAKLRFSPIANELAVSVAPKENYKNTQVDIWDVAGKKIKMNLVKSTNNENNYSAVAYSNDGTKIALGISNAKHGIEIYDATTGKISERITTPNDVVACAFSPDGNSIAAGGTDKAVSLWDLAKKTATWKSVWSTDEDGYVFGVAFSSDGKNIAACGKGSGDPVKIYDATNGKILFGVGNNNPGANCVCFSADSNFVFVGLTSNIDFAQVPILKRLRVGK